MTRLQPTRIRKPDILDPEPSTQGAILIIRNGENNKDNFAAKSLHAQC